MTSGGKIPPKVESGEGRTSRFAVPRGFTPARMLVWGAAMLAACALGATLLWPPPAILMWNASPSSPVGLYAVRPPGNPRVGDMVAAFAPAAARRLASSRGYLPSGSRW